MTLSIVARDTKTGDFGVCGYTDIAGYGSLVPHVSLKCAVATQAYVNVDNGIEMLELADTGIVITLLSANARDVFDEIDSELNFNLSKVIFEGPESDLK